MSQVYLRASQAGLGVYRVFSEQSSSYRLIMERTRRESKPTPKALEAKEVAESKKQKKSTFSLEDDPLTIAAIQADDEAQAAEGLLGLETPVTKIVPPQKTLTCHTGAVEYAKHALGDRADEVLTRLKTARKLYETTEPEKQCTEALVGKPKKDCWLCGYPLFPDEVGAQNPKRTVCEHIFPISLAVFFLELHRKENPSVVSKEAIVLEYDWAHVFCNSVKNDTPFITEKFTSDRKIEKWVVYEAGIRDMLDKIAKGANARGYPKSYVFNKAWKESHFAYIEYRINEILKSEINTQDTPILTYMLGLLKCSDPERMHAYGKLALQDQPLPPKKEENTRKRGRSEGGKRTRRRKYGAS